MGKSIAAKLGALGLLAGAAYIAPAHAAGITFCSTGNTPIPGSTVQGNLEVQSGQVCKVIGIIVKGNVTSDAGAVLFMDSSTIHGNLTVLGNTSFGFVVDDTRIGGDANISGAYGGTSGVCYSTINGSVFISNTSGGGPVVVGDIGFTTPFNPSCLGNTVRNSVSVVDNSADILLQANTIGESARITNNTSGEVTIEGNAIANSLYCSGNTSVAGADNNVHKLESGQCQGF